MAVSVLPEDFFAGLLPEKVVALDVTGVLHAVLSGFQDRSEDLRSYISYISELINPYAGYPIEGTCVSVTYTDSYGLVVTRNVLGYNLQSDPSYQAFVAGTLTQDESIAWMADVLGIDENTISSVTTVIDPFRTVYEPMLGYLAQSLGVIFPTSDPSDPRNPDMVDSHFSRLPIKGSSRSIEIAGLLAGFDAVHVSPLWGRLSPRNPVDVGFSQNDADFSESTQVEPTIEPSDFYDPLAYRDGPFFTWSSKVGLINTANFISQANGSNPYLSWLVGGLSTTNFRGVYNTASTYNRGDVAVSTTGRTFLALATTTSQPPTCFLSDNFVMPLVDDTVTVTVSDATWLSLGDSVSVYGAGVLLVTGLSGSKVTFTNKGLNGNANPGITVYAGSVIVSTSSATWLELVNPEPGIYTLSGGQPNVVASATLSSTLVVEGLAEGSSFNDMQVVIESVPDVISTISTTVADPTLVLVETTLPHGLSTGKLVFIRNVIPTGYVGLYVVTVVSETVFSYKLSTAIHTAGSAADGIVPYFDTGDFVATVFDRLSSIKYRTSYFNIVLAVDEATINARAVPVRPNPDVIAGANSGSTTAIPPYLPFSGTTEVSGSENQIDTTWLANLAAEADVILESVRPSTRNIRRFSTGILYSGSITYADYANASVIFDKTSALSGTIDGPLYPRTARVFAPGLELIGEYDPSNPNQVTFTGSPSYGAVSVDLNYVTGVFTATRPTGFPSDGSVTLEWIVTDSGTIRSEPSSLQKQIGTLGFLDRPEDDFGTVLYGSRPNVYPDVNVWSRPIERENLQRDLEPIYGDEQTFPGKFVTSVESSEGVSYAIYALEGTFPYRFRVVELNGLNPNPALAYSGTNLYRVGLRYGQILACPERTFSTEVQKDLDVWVPLNSHPDEDLSILSLYPVSTKTSQQGLLPNDRVWDSSRGWVTWMRACAVTINTGSYLDEFTLAFWFSPQSWTSSLAILSFGPVALVYSGSSQLSLYYDDVLIGSASASGFSFVSIRQKGSRIVLGINSAFVAWSITPVSVPYTGIVLDSDTEAQYYIQDLKVWSAFKLDTDVQGFYQPVLVSTQLAALPTPVEVSTTGDKWFMRVLSSGFVTIDQQPASKLVSVTDQFTSTTGGTTLISDIGTITQYPGNLLAVAAYDIEGRFIADSRRHLVGLPGGSLPSLPRKLGEAFRPVSAINKDPVSPNTGLPSGINPLWLDDTAVGTVRAVVAPFSGTGGVDSTYSTGTTSVWPNPANNTNPLTDRIWVEGDSGTTYEVRLGGGTLTPLFSVEAVSSLEISECPAGAVTILTDGTNRLSINSSGTVYTTGTLDSVSPRTHLYRHSSSTVSFTGLSGWIPSESSSTYDGHPSLASSGELMWSSNTTLIPGHYRLRIKAYNVGRVANTFSGFDTEITIGQSITFPLTLSPSSNEQETSYDFYVAETLATPWLIQAYWGGIINDPARGITYQLVISEVAVDRLATDVYRVDAGPSLTSISTTADKSFPLPSLNPGGWMASVSSSGTISEWTHEANVYPSVGGVEQSATLAELLTFSTEDKVNRVMLSPLYGSSTVLSDPSPTTPPSITSYSQILTPATTPIQVGYELEIDVVATEAVSYIWYFWDGSVETTLDASVSKTVNQGGTLSWTCVAANQYGQSSQVSGSIQVNKPPLVQSASLSHNDLPPTYSTTLSTHISDPDSASPILVWLDGETPQTISSTISGTTDGSVDFSFNVSTSSTKVLHAVDVNGGTTLLDIDIRATPVKPLLAAITATPAYQRIGSTAGVRFTCRATNPNGAPLVGEPSFLWEFLTAQGWSLTDFSGITGFTPITGGYSSTGNSSNSGAAYQNSVFVPSVSNQTAGTKIVRLTITPPTGYGSSTTLYGRVTLIENHAPVIERFDVTPEIIVPGEMATVTAIVTDADNDIIQYSWDITNCSDLIQNDITTNPVVIHPTGTILVGTLTASDQFGGYAYSIIPAVIISSSTLVNGTVGTAFTYVPRAMTATPGTFTFDAIPTGLVQVNGTVLGTPLIVGTTETHLSVVSNSGQDRRPFTWVIHAAAAAPLTPTNLAVNGDGNNPRYLSGNGLTIQWTITNDGGSLPGSVIELRTFDGTLMKTLEIPVGVNIATLSPSDILSIFGTNQDIIIRVYAVRNSVRSPFPAECIVTYAY
jgi:hypothetical protein